MMGASFPGMMLLLLHPYKRRRRRRGSKSLDPQRRNKEEGSKKVKGLANGHPEDQWWTLLGQTGFMLRWTTRNSFLKSVWFMRTVRKVITATLKNSHVMMPALCQAQVK